MQTYEETEKRILLRMKECVQVLKAKSDQRRSVGMLVDVQTAAVNHPVEFERYCKAACDRLGVARHLKAEPHLLCLAGQSSATVVWRWNCPLLPFQKAIQHGRR